MMYTVENLIQTHRTTLKLELVEGQEGIKRTIEIPEAHRPGLALAGHLKAWDPKRILIFGTAEIDFLKELNPDERFERLSSLLVEQTPIVIVSRGYRPLDEMFSLCKLKQIPLFRSTMTTTHLLSKLNLLLWEEFSPFLTRHGTLVEVFGVGMLIQGESCIGKSDAALGLIERGHRLVADDVVKVKQQEGKYLEGEGIELSRHLMEIKGIGIINVAHLYGAICVRDKKRIDLVVHLENRSQDRFYDRLGLEEKTTEILDIPIPYHILPVKPGRDIVLLLETIALNHRLKERGCHSAKDFNTKLLTALSMKDKENNNHGKTHKESTCQK